jgi:hypothetical protein
MDSVHRAVDHAGPVHRGLTALAASPSSSKLGLRPLWWPRLPDEGGGGYGEHGGPSFGLTGARKVAERQRSGSEGGSGESSDAGRLGQGAGEERWEEGMLGLPFIGS